MIENPLIIYHAECMDGWSAAFIAHRKYPNAELKPGKYGEPVPDVTGRDVFILDFSFSRAVLLEMAKKANSLLVLDHHKTAEQELAGLPFCQFDMNRSGASMAWDYFFSGQERPNLIKYVEDRDLWLWRYPNSKEVSAVIMSYEKTLANWELLFNQLETNLEHIIEQGAGILRAADECVARVIPNAREVEFEGYKVFAVNSPLYGSELANKLGETRPFGIAWFQRADGKYVYSLRASHTNQNRADVSVLAKLHGGGGHRDASGFTADTLLWS